MFSLEKLCEWCGNTFNNNNKYDENVCGECVLEKENSKIMYMILTLPY